MLRVKDSGGRVEGSGLRVQGLGFRVQGVGFRVQCSVFSVQCSVFSVQGVGFRVQVTATRRVGKRPPHPLVPRAVSDRLPAVSGRLGETPPSPVFWRRSETHCAVSPSPVGLETATRSRAPCWGYRVTFVYYLLILVYLVIY